MKLLLKVNSERTRIKRHRWIHATTDVTALTSSPKRINRVGGNASVKNSLPHNLTLTSKLLIGLIVVVLIVAAVVVYIEVQRSAERRLQQTKPAAPILFSNNYEHGTFPNLGNGHLIIDRHQWGASEFKEKKLTVPLKHPIPYVLVTHIGVQSVPCENVYKCSIKMRTIQDAAIAEKELNDIQSNFYVGDDGNIYVGRGWDLANTYANDTLALTFMGDYGRFIPSGKQVDAAQHLLAHALTSRYLDLNYKLVAHNQTKKTKSPGANVYRIIKEWPHFYPCGMDGNPRCGSELGMPAEWNGQQ